MINNKKNILISIQPRYLKLINSGEKLVEYRNHYWDLDYPHYFYIYESKPISKIKYKMLLGKPYKKGEEIPFQSYDTEKFNKGLLKRDYAYPILKVKEIDNPIDLRTLRSIGVFPPQNFLYSDKNHKLRDILNSSNFT